MDVPYGATYDGTALVSDVSGQPRFVLQCVRGLDDTWETRGEDTVIPGAHGRVARARKRDRLLIELAGWVYGTGATDATMKADFRAALDELRTLFDPTRSAASLVVALEDGGSRMIEARPLPGMLVAERLEGVAARVSVELEAVGYDWA